MFAVPELNGGGHGFMVGVGYGLPRHSIRQRQGTADRLGRDVRPGHVQDVVDPLPRGTILQGRPGIRLTF